MPIAAARQREKEIKLSRIGLIIVASNVYEFIEYDNTNFKTQYSSFATAWSGYQISTNFITPIPRKIHSDGQNGFVSWHQRKSSTLILNSLKECTSIVSSFLTTLNGSLNVFIYFFKHHKLVLGLVFPNAGQSESRLTLNHNMRQRSSWMLHRNPSRIISPLHYQFTQHSQQITSSFVRRNSLQQQLESIQKRSASYVTYQETALVTQKWVEESWDTFC